MTGTMGPDRSRSDAENKGGPAFGNGSEGSLDGHCSLLLGDDMELMQLCKTTRDTHTHTHTLTLTSHRSMWRQDFYWQFMAAGTWLAGSAVLL